MASFDIPKETLTQPALKPRGQHVGYAVSHEVNPITKRSGGLTYSNCGSNLPQRPEYYTPPGVSRSIAWGPGDDYYCCGDCTLVIREVRLFYFPGSTTSNCSMSHGSTGFSSILPSSYNKINRRVKSFMSNTSVFSSDGYT